MQKLTVGIIPDGNRKWAIKNKRSWEESYLKGADVAACLIQEMLSRGDVNRVVFFALAQENLRLRASEQIGGILAGIGRFFSLIKDLPIKVRCYGDSTPPEVAQLWPKESDFSCLPVLDVDLLFNYSATWDLATRPIQTITIPPLDLVVRTSGSARLSGFVPWQSAYAKLFFPQTLWPDFTQEELREILDDYQKSGRHKSGA